MNLEDIKEFLKDIPFSQMVEVVAIDESGLIAINKKAGVMSHPNPKGGKDGHCLVKAPYNFDKEYYSCRVEGSDEKKRIYLINRLDSHTSGLIIMAVDENIAALAKEAFKNHTVKKEYAAICFGRPLLKFGTWKDYIEKSSFGSKFVRATASFRNKSNSETNFKLIRLDENHLGLSLLNLEPLTGRTHQLRVQCANRHIPIVGDSTYGDFAENKKIKKTTGIDRLCLHCQKISIDIEREGEKISFQAECPLPESFSKLLDVNPKAIARKIKSTKDD